MSPDEGRLVDLAPGDARISRGGPAGRQPGAATAEDKQIKNFVVHYAPPQACDPTMRPNTADFPREVPVM